MKNWEVLANRHIKDLGIDFPAEQENIIEMWKVFADTGKCNDISCNSCPFGETDLCGYKKIGPKETYKERKKILNKEAGVMKEVKEWNGKPREMMVWNDDENQKEKRFVIFIEPSSNVFPYIRVITWDALTGAVARYNNCAEIEDEKQYDDYELMTNRELAVWLRADPERELSNCDTLSNFYVYSNHTYNVDAQDEKVSDSCWVRRGATDKWERPYRKLLEEPNKDVDEEGVDEEHDKFDAWFSGTFPEYVRDKKFLIPHYTVALMSYEKGFEDGARGKE